MDEKAEKPEEGTPELIQILDLEQELYILDQNIVEAKKELESLHKDLMDTQQKKEETEKYLKNVLTIANKKKAEILKEIEDYTEQRNGMNKKCEDLLAKDKQMTKDLSLKIEELHNIDAKLKKKSKELQDKTTELDRIHQNKKYISKKRKFVIIGIIIFYFLLFILCFIDNVNNISELQVEISELETLYNNTKAEKEEFLKKISNMEEAASDKDIEISELETLYNNSKAEMEKAISDKNVEISELESLYNDTKVEKEETLEKLTNMEEYTHGILMKVNKVYNSGSDATKKNEELKSSMMRYLCFDFSVFLIDDNIKAATIFVDIYKPDGTLMCSYKSPIGHTFSVDIDEQCQQVQKGWGNAEKSNFISGTYRVDFIYGNEIIYSQKVVIVNDIKLS